MRREASEDDFTERLHWPPTSLKREDTGSYSLPKCDRTTNKKFWLSRPRSESESRDLLDPHQKTIINTDFSMCKDSSVQTKTNSSFDSEGSPDRCGPLSWSILPIALSITSAIGFVCTYFFAKSNCHIQRWILPYVSYTGTEHPESMVFGLILNTEGFLGLTIVFLAWRYYRHMGQRGCLNCITLCFGAFSCFGVIIVGNFQVTKAKIPHYIGAGMAFIIGTVYGVLTSLLSRKAFRLADPPLRHGTCVSVLRIALAIVMLASLTCLTGIGMYKKLNSENKTQELDYDAIMTKTNGSCSEILGSIPPLQRYIDLIGSLTEWLLTACLLICLSLFAYEFQTFQKIKVVLLRHDGPLRCSKSSTFHSKNVLEQRLLSECTNVDGVKKTVHGHKPSQFDSNEYQSKTQRSAATMRPFVDSRLTTADSGIEDDVTQRDDVSVNLLRAQKLKLKQTHSLPNLIKTEAV